MKTTHKNAGLMTWMMVLIQIHSSIQANQNFTVQEEGKGRKFSLG
jgi:hypothetical protein